MDSSHFLKEIGCQDRKNHGNIAFADRIVERKFLPKARGLANEMYLYRRRRRDYRKEVSFHRDGAAGCLGGGSVGIYCGDEEKVLGRKA